MKENQEQLSYKSQNKEENMNRTDFANAPRNKKLSLTDEYRGTQEFKNKE